MRLTQSDRADVEQHKVTKGNVVSSMLKQTA
ncbi:hypothetical protein FDP48_05255 [Enterococcus faecalis]|nr:hypothetical protein [Enterococcus faecalis]